MEIIIAFIIGVLVGIAIRHRRPLGNLRLDRSDPDSGPYLFMELTTDLPDIVRRKYVTFRVRIEDFVPRK